MAQHCRRPPRGWVCHLPVDHDGPCPTYPTGPKAAVARRLMPVVERWFYGF